jgi:prepilin-type N-terminal cleavage/methylation domain-containing protein
MKMRKNGFTLIEVIIAMAVGAAIMVAVYGFMTLVQKNSVNTDRKIVTLQDTRTVLDLMAMEIRMASYNPKGVVTTWSNNPSPALLCMPNLTADKVTYKGIRQADANSITVAMDLDGSGTIADGANEWIVYSYDGVSTITRSANCSSSPILGGNALSSNVRNAAAGVNLFRYFDGNNIDITTTVTSSPASTINGIPAIRRILITIVADTADIDLNTHQPKRVVYSTSVIVRNHALN